MPDGSPKNIHLLNSQDRRLAEQTGRDRPHNFGFDFPEPCVGCGETQESWEDGCMLAGGWLYCGDCDPEQSYHHVPKRLYDHVQTVSDAAGYAHVPADPDYHPLGGYWLPVDESKVVKDHPPSGELIHYPCDEDRDPSIVGADDLPSWVRA